MVGEAPGDEMKVAPEHMKWFWLGAFGFVAFFGYGLTDWELLEHLLENQGVGEEGASMLAFAAGYTFPLTLGVGTLVLLWLRGTMNEWGPYGLGVVVAVVLFTSGLLAAELGLGLLPEFEITLPEGGHPAARIAVWALQGYFNTYGWGLMITAVAIGSVAALHIDVWLRSSDQASRAGS